MEHARRQGATRRRRGAHPPGRRRRPVRPAPRADDARVPGGGRAGARLRGGRHGPARADPALEQPAVASGRGWVPRRQGASRRDGRGGRAREAQEEVGIRPEEVDVVGALEDLATVAGGFVLSPFVGVMPGRPHLVPNPGEVARVFDVAVADLLDESVYHEERWRLPGMGERPMHFFELADETVWGATARILFELLILVTEAEIAGR